MLQDPRHENFARHLAEGRGVHMASKLVGYTSTNYGLANDPVMKQRVQEIMKEGESDAVMKSREWQERETRAARIDIRDYFDLTTGLMLPMSMWSAEAAEAVESIEFNSLGLPKIKLRKTSSMNNLGKNLGTLTDKVELSGPGGGPVRTINSTMTPQEAAEAYAAMLNPGAV